MHLEPQVAQMSADFVEAPTALETNLRNLRNLRFQALQPERTGKSLISRPVEFHPPKLTIATDMDPVAQLKSLIRDIPDFPKPGILFRDITPLLADAAGLALSIELLANPFRGKGIDLVIGAESRGFIFGTAVACAISAGFQLVRKPGKLPHKRIAMQYELEYGTDTLEMHADAIVKGQRVLIVDDVLATGGTMTACCNLVRQLEGEIAGVAVMIELEALGGRKKVAPADVHSVLVY
jgi:adenine phosphoribosyltransferase